MNALVLRVPHNKAGSHDTKIIPFEANSAGLLIETAEGFSTGTSRASAARLEYLGFVNSGCFTQ